MKVSINNFQSVEAAELEVKGLTVLVGKSNLGKSAIIRAISGALNNRQGDAFVTEGADHTEVTLQVPARNTGASSSTDEAPGLSLTWRKGGGYNDYEIDGVDLKSVSRGAPPQIKEAGFGDLETSRESLSVQVADQFNPLFLLNDSGSVAAEAISDVGRLAELQEALRRCDSDRRSKKAELKIRKQDLSDAQAELSKYDTFDDDMTHVEEVKNRFLRIRALEQELQTLERLDAASSRHAQVIESLSSVESVEIVDLDPVMALTQELRDLANLQQQSQRHLETVKSLRGVEDCILPDALAPSLVDEMQSLARLWDSAKRHVDLLKKGKSLADLEVVETQHLYELEQEIQNLDGILTGARTHARAGKQAKQESAEIEAQLQKLEKEYHDTLHLVGVCPVCDQEVL